VLAAGLDVLAVDLTTAELRAGGLAAAKVLVPGTLPMTFGHAHRRLTGLPRLLTVPHQLGYADRPLDPAQLCTLPHPFP
jgi:ribosomal protein S12 methylthiotransferase accessory factor